MLTRVFSLAGVLIGVALGREIRLTKWIFAVTAGMFLFIALVEMVSAAMKMATNLLNLGKW